MFPLVTALGPSIMLFAILIVLVFDGIDRHGAERHLHAKLDRIIAALRKEDQ